MIPRLNMEVSFMRFACCLLLASMLILTTAAFAEERVVWNQIIDVAPGQLLSKSVTFRLPLINGRLGGSFQATGGAGNEITFHVLTANEFKAFNSRETYTPLYTAERRRSDVVSVPIRDAGTYYL